MFALLVAGDRVYVGGEFDSIGGESRTNLAALDATTGVPSPRNPRPDDTVFSLAASGSQLVVGGDFHGVGSEAHSGLGALDLTTATPLFFHGRFRGIGGDAVDLNALAIEARVPSWR